MPRFELPVDGTVHCERGGRLRMQTAETSLLIALSILGAGSARADEPPALRQGLWHFDRTVGGQKVQTQQCASPSEDMKRQNAILDKGGCKFSPAERAGKTYTFTAECTIKTPGGETVNARSTSVMTVENDSAYQVEITTTGAGTSTQEQLVARRLGDCPK
jgi:hypothetical protein